MKKIKRNKKELLEIKNLTTFLIIHNEIMGLPTGIEPVTSTLPR